MTVKELIIKLQKCDPQHEVLGYNNYNSSCPNCWHTFPKIFNLTLLNVKDCVWLSCSPKKEREMQ